MIEAKATKQVIGVLPTAKVNNAAVTIASVDRKGFDYLQVLLELGTTDIGLTTCKLQEADDNSTFTDVPNSDYSISGTLPASGNGNTLWRWDVDLKGRKRYIRAAITVGSGSTGAYVTVIYNLARPEQAPYEGNIATMGLTGLLTL
jgi:hypothetical protein